MGVTHLDVKQYIDSVCFGTSNYSTIQDKFVVRAWVEFRSFKFSTLPLGLVFNNHCDLDNSNILYLPDDLILKGGLFLLNTKITEVPVLNIGGVLDIRNTKNLVLNCGTFIRGNIWADPNSQYYHLHEVDINGYIFSTGVLS